MELANAMLALGGDKGMTVPKYEVTPAEIAVLMSIHGDDAVFDIEPLGRSVERSTADEMDRLSAHYPAKDANGNFIIAQVYPGRMPILHRRIADLGLSGELFKATGRMSAESVDAIVNADEPEPAVEPAPVPKKGKAAPAEADPFAGI